MTDLQGPIRLMSSLPDSSVALGMEASRRRRGHLSRRHFRRDCSVLGNARHVAEANVGNRAASSVSSLSPFAGSASMTTAGALPSDFGTTGIPGNACAYSNAPPSRTACADRTKGIGSGSAPGLRAIWLIQSRTMRCAPSARSSKSSLAARSCASHKLKHCSTAHCAFADRLEADHATRALERMKRAPHGGQRGLIIARGTQHLELLADAVENVTRFLNEIWRSSLSAAASDTGIGAVGFGVSAAPSGARAARVRPRLRAGAFSFSCSNNCDARAAFCFSGSLSSKSASLASVGNRLSSSSIARASPATCISRTACVCAASSVFRAADSTLSPRRAGRRMSTVRGAMKSSSAGEVTVSVPCN